MTLDKMNEKLTVTGRNLPISEATRRRNPHLFAVGGLRNQEPKPHALPALDKGQKAHQRGVGRVVLRIEIISCRPRLLDFVNLVAGCKALQDAIAADLGIDDADPRVEWAFHQIKSNSLSGTIVKIQQL